MNDKEAEDRRLYQKHLEIIKRVDDMPEERDGKGSELLLFFMLFLFCDPAFFYFHSSNTQARQQQAVLSTHKRTKQHFQEILKRG